MIAQTPDERGRSCPRFAGGWFVVLEGGLLFLPSSSLHTSVDRRDQPRSLRLGSKRSPGPGSQTGLLTLREFRPECRRRRWRAYCERFQIAWFLQEIS